MKSISFLVDYELHKDFKLTCVINGRQIKERLIELMEKDIEENKKNSLPSDK